VKKIAVLGLGAMGSRMARRLIDHPGGIIVYNRSIDKTSELVDLGAEVAASPRAAAAAADLIVSVLTDDDAAREVWLKPETGAIHGMSSGKLAFECSTVTPSWIAELAAEIHDCGSELMDLPIAGSRPQAEQGQLVLLAGGSGQAYDAAVTALVPTVAMKIHHLGPLGQGCRFKLANNALLGIQVAALAEVMGYLGKAGFDLQHAVNVLADGPLMSPFAKLTANAIIAGNHAPVFPLDLVVKDFCYAKTAATEIGAEMPMMSAGQRVFEQAVSAGLGAENISAIGRIYGRK
jgi:3-hydroxyisobutyrate dehydrogenase